MIYLISVLNLLFQPSLHTAIPVDFIFVETANLQIELARLTVPHSHTRARLTRSRQSMTRFEGYKNRLH